MRRIDEIHTERAGGEIEETIPKVAIELERIARGDVPRYTRVAEDDRLVVAFGRDRTDVVYYLANESNGASIDLHAALGFEEVARNILPPNRRTDAPQTLFRKYLA